SEAYAVVTSLSTIGLYISYILPVWLVWRARRAGAQLERGPWHLGRYSSLINVVAILWVIFLCVVLSLPDQQRAGKTFAAFTALLGLWYLLRERHRFNGPLWSNQPGD